MIGVALVGLITIFASSLKLSISGQIDQAFRGDLVVVGDAGPGSSFSPAMADAHRRGARRRGGEPAAVRRVRGQRLGPVPDRVATRRARPRVRPRPAAGRPRPRSSRTRSRCRRRSSTTSTGSSVSRAEDEVPGAGRGAGDDRRRLRARPARGAVRLLHVARRLRQALQPDRRQPGVHRARSAAPRSRRCGPRSRPSPSSSPARRSTTSAGSSSSSRPRSTRSSGSCSRSCSSRSSSRCSGS